MLVRVERVGEDTADSGAGTTPMVYTTSPSSLGGGGVQSMVTVEMEVPFTVLLSFTLLGGPPIRRGNNLLLATYN